MFNVLRESVMNNIIITLAILLLSSTIFAAPTLHLDKKITLASGNTVSIYNAGARVDVNNAQGQLQQRSCFTGCIMPFKTATAFLATLQKAVKTNNKNSIDAMVSYPLRINGSHLNITTAKDFRQHYKQIFTQHIRQAILQQNPYTLFANSQGVMIAGGQVWFTKISNHGDSHVLITVINH